MGRAGSVHALVSYRLRFNKALLRVSASPGFRGCFLFGVISAVSIQIALLFTFTGRAPGCLTSSWLSLSSATSIKNRATVHLLCSAPSCRTCSLGCQVCHIKHPGDFSTAWQAKLPNLFVARSQLADEFNEEAIQFTCVGSAPGGNGQFFLCPSRRSYYIS